MSDRHLSRGARLGWTLLLALLLVGLPAAAQAKFTDGAQSAATVRTLTLTAPTNLTGTMSCPRSGQNSGTASPTWTAVSRATSYTVTLDPPTGSNVTKQVATTSTTISAPGSTSTRGTWTVTVRANIGSWSGPAATGSAAC